MYPWHARHNKNRMFGNEHSLQTGSHVRVFAHELPVFSVHIFYFATATASSNFTESSFETPSEPIVTP